MASSYTAAMILTVLALPLLQIGCPALRRGIRFEVRPQVSAILKQIQDERFTLQSGAKVLRLSGECRSDFGMKALVADFNFDGWRDLALPSGTGYGGVNTFYTLYFYRPRTGTFQKSRYDDTTETGIRANLEPDLQTRTVSNSYKSGPTSVDETLCVTPDGLDLYACRRGEIGNMELATAADDYDWTWYDPSGNVMTTRRLQKSGENRSLWTVVPDRLTLHAGPVQVSPASAYVIRGDQVEVLELRGNQKSGWAHVSYRGKGDRVFSGWVQRSALH